MFGLLQLSSEQRLYKAATAILRKREANGKPRYAALASILMLGKREVVDWCPTAGTDGCNEFYGDKFVQGLSDSDLRGLMLHECKHKGYKHPTHGSKSQFAKMHCTTPEAKQLANVAMDYVINLEIVDENPDGFATLPKGGMFDEKFRGMDWMEVFLDIKKNGAPKPNGGTGDDGTGDGTGDDGTGDGGTGDGGAPTTMDSHDWEDTLELDDAKKAEVGKQVDEAIRQGVMAARKLGSDDLSLADLVKPQVDWRRLLREFVSTTCSGSDISTYRRPNKRLAYTGVYHPSSYSESVGELVVAIDTSGSIGKAELTKFLTEITSLCETVRPSRVRLLYWGSRVVGDETYDLNQLDTLATSTKPLGGGGTEPCCVPAYISEHKIQAQAVIMLTDGYIYGSWGKYSSPVLWCVLDNPRAQPATGKVVHIQTKQM